MIEMLQGKTPRFGSPCLVSESATVIGDVTVGKRCSVWPGAVVRGDLNSISVGDGTSIQDNCVVHVDHIHPVRVGNNVTVGHAAVLHGCTVGDGTLIGINATILEGAEVGEWSIVGAGAVVLTDVRIPPRSMVLGVPAKVVRSLTEAELAMLREHAEEYWRLAERYLQAIRD